MASTRQFNADTIFASGALTIIDPDPVSGVAYRDPNLTGFDLEQGFRVNDSGTVEIFNQVFFTVFSFLNEVDRFGIAGWSDLVNYSEGAVVRGSDNSHYRATADSGPDDVEGVRDPTVAANVPSFWEDFGTVQNVMAMDADRLIDSNNVVRAITTTTGLDVNGTTLDLNNALLGTPVTYDMRNMEGGSRISVDGNQITLQRIDSSATNATNWLRSNSNAQTEIFNNGAIVARTFSSANGGLQVLNSNTGSGFERVLTESDLAISSLVDNNNTTRVEADSSGANILGTVLDLDNSSSNALTSLFVRNSEGGLQLLADGNQALLRRTDSGGANATNVLRANATGQLALFNANTEVVRTLAATDGSLEVLNNSTGSGFERVLTTSDMGGGSGGGGVLSREIRTTPVVMTNNIFVNIFTSVTLAADTTYLLRFIGSFRGSTFGLDPGVRFRFSFTNASTFHEGHVVNYADNTEGVTPLNVDVFSSANSVVVLESGDASVAQPASAQGYMMITTGSAGTVVTPQASTEDSRPSVDLTLASGAMFEVLETV